MTQDLDYQSMTMRSLSYHQKKKPDQVSWHMGEVKINNLANMNIDIVIHIWYSLFKANDEKIY